MTWIVSDCIRYKCQIRFPFRVPPIHGSLCEHCSRVLRLSCCSERENAWVGSRERCPPEGCPGPCEMSMGETLPEVHLLTMFDGVACLLADLSGCLSRAQRRLHVLPLPVFRWTTSKLHLGSATAARAACHCWCHQHWATGIQTFGLPPVAVVASKQFHNKLETKKLWASPLLTDIGYQPVKTQHAGQGLFLWIGAAGSALPPWERTPQHLRRPFIPSAIPWEASAWKQARLWQWNADRLRVGSWKLDQVFTAPTIWRKSALEFFWHQWQQHHQSWPRHFRWSDKLASPGPRSEQPARTSWRTVHLLSAKHIKTY